MIGAAAWVTERADSPAPTASNGGGTPLDSLVAQYGEPVKTYVVRGKVEPLRVGHHLGFDVVLLPEIVEIPLGHAYEFPRFDTQRTQGGHVVPRLGEAVAHVLAQEFQFSRNVGRPLFGEPREVGYVQVHLNQRLDETVMQVA